MNLAGSRPATRWYPYGVPRCDHLEPCDATAVVSVVSWYDRRPHDSGFLCGWHLRELLTGDIAAMENRGVYPVDPDDPFVPPGFDDAVDFYARARWIDVDDLGWVGTLRDWSPDEPVRGAAAAPPPTPHHALRRPVDLVAVATRVVVALGLGVLCFGAFLAVSSLGTWL